MMKPYSVGVHHFEIDTDRGYADAAVEIGENIHRLFPELISEDDAVLMGEDVLEGLRADDPYRTILTPSDILHFRVF